MRHHVGELVLIGVLERELQIAPQQPPQERQPLGAVGNDLAEAGAEPLEAGSAQRHKDLFLVRKVDVEAGLGEANALRELPSGDGLVALADEELLGSRQDLGPALVSEAARLAPPDMGMLRLLGSSLAHGRFPHPTGPWIRPAGDVHGVLACHLPHCPENRSRPARFPSAWVKLARDLSAKHRCPVIHGVRQSSWQRCWSGSVSRRPSAAATPWARPRPSRGRSPASPDGRPRLNRYSSTTPLCRGNAWSCHQAPIPAISSAMGATRRIRAGPTTRTSRCSSSSTTRRAARTASCTAMRPPRPSCRRSSARRPGRASAT